MSPTTKTSALHKVTFRLPEDLYLAIQQAAHAETRPVNSQVIVLLREALAARKKKSVGRTAPSDVTP